MTSATVGAIDIVAWFVYLFSAVLFVVGLHFMNSPKTARKGNQISAFGMVVAVLMAFIVLFAKGFVNIVAVVVLVVGILISWYIKNSKMGYYLQAISTNPEAANSLGVNVMAMKLKANAISAFMLGVGGTFYSFFLNVIDPSKMLGYDMSVQILLFAIIGGSGTLVGPILAAVLLVPVQDILRGIVGASVQGLAPMVYGLILIIFVYYLPRGLWPSIVTLYENLTFKKKQRMAKDGR